MSAAAALLALGDDLRDWLEQKAREQPDEHEGVDRLQGESPPVDMHDRFPAHFTNGLANSTSNAITRQ